MTVDGQMGAEREESSTDEENHRQLHAGATTRQPGEEFPSGSGVGHRYNRRPRSGSLPTLQVSPERAHPE